MDFCDRPQIDCLSIDQFELVGVLYDRQLI